MENWINILTYMLYWDFARIFLIKYNGLLYAFECRFEEDIDDYPDSFSVYKVLDLLKEKHNDTDELRCLLGNYLEYEEDVFVKIPISEFTFDATRKTMIKDDFLQKYPLD